LARIDEPGGFLSFSSCDTGRPAFSARGGQTADVGFAVPARAAGVPEAREAIAANFAEAAMPTRALPRGSLVDLLI
jgi:hypothetical protein